MIASVRGRVMAVAPDGAVVEVGGVGLAVTCGPNTLASLRVGEEARLATSLVVREDSLTLYGFADDDSRSLFELLQTASGVGPRLAQAVLSVHTPDVIRRAISTGDTATPNVRGRAPAHHSPAVATSLIRSAANRPEGREPQASGGHGRLGYLSNAGLRFSKYACLPSWASSVM